MDEAQLPLHKCSALLGVAPTAEEVEILKGYDGDVNLLGTTERWSDEPPTPPIPPPHTHPVLEVPNITTAPSQRLTSPNHPTHPPKCLEAPHDTTSPTHYSECGFVLSLFERNLSSSSPPQLTIHMACNKSSPLHLSLTMHPHLHSPSRWLFLSLTLPLFRLAFSHSSLWYSSHLPTPTPPSPQPRRYFMELCAIPRLTWRLRAWVCKQRLPSQVGVERERGADKPHPNPNPCSKP